MAWLSDTWTQDDYDTAIDKAERGKPLSDNERNHLEYDKTLEGRSTAAQKALDDNKSKFGK